MDANDPRDKAGWQIKVVLKKNEILCQRGVRNEKICKELSWGEGGCIARREMRGWFLKEVMVQR